MTICCVYQGRDAKCVLSAGWGRLALLPQIPAHFKDHCMHLNPQANIMLVA